MLAFHRVGPDPVQSLDWHRFKQRRNAERVHRSRLASVDEDILQALRQRSASVSDSLSSEEELVHDTQTVQHKLSTPEQKRHHQSAARAVARMDSRLSEEMLQQWKDSCVGMASKRNVTPDFIQSHDRLCQNLLAACH